MKVNTDIEDIEKIIDNKNMSTNEKAFNIIQYFNDIDNNREYLSRRQEILDDISTLECDFNVEVEIGFEELED